ncbi:hypothetical protein AC579_4968 [Pseudocercospora musae]|nr:hypothetical protein AC579_4968 [Pseudocercospora musae]
MHELLPLPICQCSLQSIRHTPHQSYGGGLGLYMVHTWFFWNIDTRLSSQTGTRTRLTTSAVITLPSLNTDCSQQHYTTEDIPPTTMKAIKIVEGHKAELKDVPIPKLRDDYVLCKVKAVALNPTDWKHIDKIGKPGSTIGVDFAGVVEEIGPKVTKNWKKGDRIANFCHGGNETQPEDGTFGEYCVTKGDHGLKIPSSLSDEEAATLSAGVITCGQALYQSLGLPLPGQGKYDGYVLIYGASTASGTLAVQYANLSGAKVIAICSERNFSLVKKLGAVEAFDYKDPDCAKKVREYTNNSLRLVLDCIAEGSSPSICENCVSSSGGTISYLLKATHSRKDVENKWTLGYTVVGESFQKLGNHVPAKSEDFEFTKKFWDLTQGLFEEGKLKPHPHKLGEKGLEGVFDGLEMLRKGEVSGVKLVYRVEDTPGL